MIDSSFRLNLVIPMIKFFRYFIEAFKADPKHIRNLYIHELDERVTKVPTNIVNQLVQSPFNQEFFDFVQPLIIEHGISCDF